MRLKWYCSIGLGVYALLSAVDLLLTFILLQSNGLAYESNPAAAACLELHGWRGLALFKVGGVAVFIGAVALVARRRPKVGAAVVTLGCAVLLAVTIYSHGLIRNTGREQVNSAAREDVRDIPGPESAETDTEPVPEKPRTRRAVRHALHPSSRPAGQHSRHPRW